MTAINGLAEVAGRIEMDGRLLETVAVLKDAELSMRALCESLIAALGDVTSYDFYRSEFRLPAEPPDLRHEPDQESVQQQSPAVNVGVNIYAIARQIQEAVDSIKAETISVPAVYSNYAFAGEMPAPPELPTADVSFSREYSRELTKEHSHELSREVTKESGIEVVREPILGPSPQPSPPRNRHAYGSPWYRSQAKGPFEKPTEKPHAAMQLPEARREEPSRTRASSGSLSIEQNIKRSTLVISQMENVVRNIVSTESIAQEVRQSSSTLEQLQNVRTNVMGAQQPSLPTQPPIETGAIRPGVPVQWPSGQKAGPALELQKASGDSTANARSLSGALARSVSAPKEPAPPTVQGGTIKVELPSLFGSQSTPIARASKALTTIINSYSTASDHAGYGMAQASIVRLMMAGPEGSPAVSAAINASRSISSAVPVTGAQSPIAKLINNVAPPNVSASPVDVLVQMDSVASPVIPAQPGRPAVNLAVSMAAAQAARSAGASVIREFVAASPSLTGGIQPGAMANNNIINVSMPGVNVEREVSNNVSRTSSFHNTFNITVNVKGGSEEGDLRELGRKIGWILSDEIKRYGGA